MTPARALRHIVPWSFLLPIAFVIIFVLIIAVHRPSELISTGDFVLPQRGSGRPVQALYQVEAIAALDGWTFESLRLAGDLWREAGDRTQALSYWQAAARMNAEPTILRDIAQTALELQDWASARDALDQIVSQSSQDRWANLQLGLLLSVIAPAEAAHSLTVAAGENAYASLAADVMDTLDEADSMRTLHLGRVLAEHALWSFAELAFSTAAEQGHAPEAIAYTGFARDWQGKDGSGWIDRAVALAPDNATVRLLQGLHLRQNNAYDDSLQAMIMAVRLDPSNAVLYAELGTAYQLVGDYSQARRWIGEALALTDDERYQRMLDTLTASEDQLLEMLSAATDQPDEATAEPLP